MKKAAVFVLISMIAMMAGCHQTVATSSPINDQPQPAAAAQSTSVALETEEPIVVETPAPTPEVKVEWQTLTYQWEDRDGYKFEATVKVSPWINTKNETYLSSAWDEISQGKSLPKADPNEWGLKPVDGDYRAYDNSGLRFLPTGNITDVYYCVGEISVKNLTDGWNITAATPITSNTLWLSASQPEIDAEDLKDHHYLKEKYMESRTMGAAIRREDWGTVYSFLPTWLEYNPKYTSDTWGPATFAFAHFESKTPNAPGGEHMSEITETYFCVDRTMFGPVTEESTKTKLSVIDYVVG